MTIIKIKDRSGIFAENKDVARDIRINIIIPELKAEKEIVLDFSGIEGATQSFIHALISEPLRQYGPNLLDKIKFKNCNKTIQKIITIVTEYMQEAN